MEIELAARAGVTQSVISAYESGHRQPAVSTLAALIEVAGFELTVGIRRPPHRLQMLSGPIGRVVRRHRRELIAAAAVHRVSNLRVFGSVARGQDRPDSTPISCAPRAPPPDMTTAIGLLSSE
ncbi:helix-turn-helix domain-containing protein [Frankia sp. Cr2]|uniref:helix-turn-helix domain-containing protein n=1 Tax=Frankia sp. Cr2 TaxID=3073932 RepID=UPI002AD3D3D5|nr:helix-turn-helix domain-containing protein [Frankia sp. Cr2]